MGEPFIGSEAVAAGALTPLRAAQQVRRAVSRRLRPTRRRGHRRRARQGCVVVVRASRRRRRQSAAALHGAKWVDAVRPAELLWPNRYPPKGIHTWSDQFADDEIDAIDGIRVTTPARTALDLACRYPTDRAVAAIDALARATRLEIAEVELLADRYKGRRGIRRA